MFLKSNRENVHFNLIYSRTVHVDTKQKKNGLGVVMQLTNGDGCIGVLGRVELTMAFHFKMWCS
jgi:hypothetical protein